MKKKKSFKLQPLFLLAAAIVLLLASTVGSTQAALSYYSENFMAQVTVSNIGITLLENGNEVSRRNYVGTDREAWDDTNDKGILLTKMLGEGEKFVPGKKYPEAISAGNSGAIDAYVRMIITKSWKNANGETDTSLSPELIQLNLLTGNGWFVDEKASTAERTVLYYSNVLKVGATTPACTDTLSIDSLIGTKVIENVTTDDAGNRIINYTTEYDGYTFHVEAEVDAVQTHNAADAIKSAWGVDVAVAADGSISLK